MSLDGLRFEAVAAVKWSGAEMSVGDSGRILIGHQTPISTVISAPESS